MLFCVTTRGRERIFSNPRDSSMVRTASIRIAELALINERPLVGPVAGKLENNGICAAVVGVAGLVPTIGYFGAIPNVESVDVPAASGPPTPVEALPQPNPS